VRRIASGLLAPDFFNHVAKLLHIQNHEGFLLAFDDAAPG
jgi:hypothetical protein